MAQLRHISKIVLLIIFILSGIISCCNDDCINPDDCMNPDDYMNCEVCSTAEGIFGTWVWKRSYGGLSGNYTLTPQSVGYTEKYVFDDYLFEKYKDDVLILSMQYDLERRPQSYLGIHEFLVLENAEDYALELSNDTMSLHDQAFDGFVHEYIRE